MQLRVTGEPGATVGLLAVNKGVHVLNNQHRLTQEKVRKKNQSNISALTQDSKIHLQIRHCFIDVACCCVTQVWDLVQELDTSCTPGGGQDAMHVFHDAGLMFQSNSPTLETPERNGENRIVFLFSFVLSGDSKFSSNQ